MLKTVLIGFGKIAAGYSKDQRMNKFFNYSTHAKILKDHPHFLLKAVVDIDQNSLDEAKNNWGVEESVKSIDELKNLSEFDIAVIAIPPKGRFDIIKKFSNLKAIVIEKPIAENIEEALKIREFCKSRRILVQVNFPRRFDSKIVNYMQNFSQQFGETQCAFGLYGNGLQNNGSHLVDLARLFLGNVNWVQSQANLNYIKEGPILNDKNFPFTIGFKSNVNLMVQVVKYQHYRELMLDIWTTKGRLTFIQESLLSSISFKSNHRFLENNFEIQSDKPIIKLMDQSHAMYHLYSNLYDAIIGKDILKSNIMDSIELMRIINNLEVSQLKNDQRIFLNE